MKYVVITAVSLIVLLTAAQLVRVSRTGSPPNRPIRAPSAVNAILDRACADCHTQSTRWPWYSRVAPASWLVAHDVKNGRENLNFSYWGLLSLSDRQTKAKAVVDQLKGGGMPLWYYLIMHPGARLNPVDREALARWFSGPDAIRGSADDSLSASPQNSGVDDELWESR